MRYKDYNPYQQMLMPPDISDLIPEDSPIWVIMQVVNPSVVSDLETSKSEEGNSAYNPLMMVRLLTLGYYYKITSSRQLQKRTHTDAEFIYITGWQHPDFRTICRFRKENEEFLTNLYKKIYRTARQMGLTNLGLISIDGTIIKASASDNKAKKVSKWREIEKSLDKKINDYHTKCAKTDNSEDLKLGKNNNGGLPKEIQDAKKRKEKIQQALAQIDEEDALADVRINISDPHARFVKKSSGGKCTLGYRVGIAVDENQMIADIQMSNVSNDAPLFRDCIKGVEETIGGPIPEGTRILADNGCSSAQNTKLLEDKKLDGYICQAGEFKTLSNNRYKHRHDCPFFLSEEYYLKILGKGKKNLKKVSFAHIFSVFPCFPINFFWNLVDFKLSIKFDYDEERDVLICPMGQELHHDGKIRKESKTEGKRKRIVYRVHFKCELSCQGCPLKKKCTPGANHRLCKRYVGYDSLERMRRKMQKAESLEVYKKRRSTVEPVFGNIKKNLGFKTFNIRGFAGKLEMGLKALCHNIKKLAKIPETMNLTWVYPAA